MSEFSLVLENGNKVTVNAPRPTQLETGIRFHPELAETIIFLVREGLSFKDVSSRCGVPVSAIYRWRRTQEKFGDELYLARKEAADVFAHKVQEIAEEDVLAKEDVPGARLKSDLFKWLAEKADPGHYGNQTKITGDENAPLKIIVDTGIRREGDSVDPNVCLVDEAEQSVTPMEELMEGVEIIDAP